MSAHNLKPHERPLVSIITPTFNHEKFIGPCIESVLSQMYPNWEQIIVDDGSTDRTRRVIAQYKDPRIHYLYQERRGIEALPHTYNKALSLARGSLVAILEGDDIWPSNKLSAQIGGFEDAEVVLSYGIVGELSADGKWGGQLTRSARHNRNLLSSLLSNSPTGSATRYLLSNNNLVPPSTAIIRRSTLDSIGGFQYVPGLCVTDFPTFLRVSLEGKFSYTPSIMGFRRRHLQSVSLTNLDKILAAAYKHSLDFVTEHNLPLTTSERTFITESWCKGRVSNAFVNGRSRLVHRDWGNARKAFVKAARFQEPRVLLASVLGWSMSWLRCDLEWVFRMNGRAVIKP